MSDTPTLYVLNVAAVTKPHAVQHLTADLTGYQVHIAVITETHLKKKHDDQLGYLSLMATRGIGEIAWAVEAAVSPCMLAIVTKLQLGSALVE